MCGLTGFFCPEGAGNSAERTLRRMAGVICHRGPDDEGYWSDEEARIALGHRRLSIIDLSPHGHQPMASPSGRFVTAFNGEIYNFDEIRVELLARGTTFRGHSDTEVLLGAFDEWGVVAGIKKAAGMFALAVWDKQERRLHLIRDRLGEKPLYYGRAGNSLLFGSELKALQQHPEWRGEIDRNSLALYLRHNYVPGPYTIYKGIYKAPPGKVLTFTANGGLEPTHETYWSVRAAADYGRANPLQGSEGEVISACDSILRRTIKQEMISDVPLGAFLSGGLDSSLVVALMQAQSSSRVRTFTIGFHENEYNEAQHAKAVAKHLGTDHTELYVSADDTLAVIPKLATIYDEPFADASQIPTFLLSELTRRHVTVSLSGDGGDELFGGYNRYFWGPRIWGKLRPLPAFFRRSVAGAMTSVKPESWDKLFGAISGGLPSRYRIKIAGDRVHKLASVLASPSAEALYRGLTSNWLQPAELALNSSEPDTPLTDRSQWLATPNFSEQMMYLDSVTYLPDDILVKVDRASMAVSLESRAPYLDHRVAEFAWRLPLSMKIRNGRGKWILREVLDRYVPRELIDRPKMGFGVPIDHWLRGPLREWASELLAPERIRAEGYFNSEAIQEKWKQHQTGARNWQYPLWSVLVFQAWFQARETSPATCI